MAKVKTAVATAKAGMLLATATKRTVLVWETRLAPMPKRISEKARRTPKTARRRILKDCSILSYLSQAEVVD